MRIVIVEDNPVFLESVSIVLDAHESFEVAGKYSSAEEALEKLGDSIPDIFIVDLGLPCMPGLDLIKKIKSEHPSVDVIAFTGTDDRKTILSAIRAGASGYLVKGISPEELIWRIRMDHNERETKLVIQNLK